MANLEDMTADELFDLAEAIEQELYERIRDGRIHDKKTRNI